MEDNVFNDFKRLKLILETNEEQLKLIKDANNVSLRLESREYNNVFGNESEVVRTIPLDTNIQQDIVKYFEEKINTIKERILTMEEEYKKSVFYTDKG